MNEKTNFRIIGAEAIAYPSIKPMQLFDRYRYAYYTLLAAKHSGEHSTDGVRFCADNIEYGLLNSSYYANRIEGSFSSPKIKGHLYIISELVNKPPYARIKVEAKSSDADIISYFDMIAKALEIQAPMQKAIFYGSVSAVKIMEIEKSLKFVEETTEKKAPEGGEYGMVCLNDANEIQEMFQKEGLEDKLLRIIAI